MPAFDQVVRFTKSAERAADDAGEDHAGLGQNGDRTAQHERVVAIARGKARGTGHPSLADEPARPPRPPALRTRSPRDTTPSCRPRPSPRPIRNPARRPRRPPECSTEWAGTRQTREAGRSQSAEYQLEASPRVMLSATRVELILEQHERHQDQAQGGRPDTANQRMEDRVHLLSLMSDAENRNAAPRCRRRARRPELGSRQRNARAATA